MFKNDDSKKLFTAWADKANIDPSDRLALFAVMAGPVVNPDDVDDLLRTAMARPDHPWDINKMKERLSQTPGVNMTPINALITPATDAIPMPGPVLVKPIRPLQTYPSDNTPTASQSAAAASSDASAQVPERPVTTPFRPIPPQPTPSYPPVTAQPKKAGLIQTAKDKLKGIGASWGSRSPRKPTFATATTPKVERNKVSSVVLWSTVILLLLLMILGVGVAYRLGSTGNTDSLPENGASPSYMTSQSCVMENGQQGVKKYQVVPKAELVGRHGFINSTLSIEDLEAPVFDGATAYDAVLESGYYVVAVAPGHYVYARVTDFVENPTIVCVDPAGMTFLTDAINSNTTKVEVTYKLNFSHWSGWLVIFAMFCVAGFALISLFMSGDDKSDLVGYFIFIIAIAYHTHSSTATGISYFVLYVGAVTIATILFGSKSELKQLNEQFQAGGQFKIPDATRPIFDSLSRGFGIVGGYDWSKTALTHAIFVFIGAISLNSSPLYRAFGDHIWAIAIGGLFIVLSFAMEAYRRGAWGDWAAFGLGLFGLADLPIFILMFGDNAPRLSQLGPIALAVIVPLIILFIAFVFNFVLQSSSERNELARDRMADGMLMFSTMKLVAILLYIYMYLV